MTAHAASGDGGTDRGAPQRPFKDDDTVKVASKIWTFCVLLGLVSFGLVIIFGNQGLFDLYRQRVTLERQMAQNKRQERINISLLRRIERLKNDPVYLDRVARDELLMVGPGEFVITLPDPPAGGKDS